MGLLYLEDLLNRAGINPNDVMLIRHSYGDSTFAKCAEAGKIREYTQHQQENFAKGSKYWMVFVADKGTQAKFYACYEIVAGPNKADISMCSPDFPFPEWYEKNDEYVFELQESDIMREYNDRLIIDWGKGVIAWKQWGYNKKEILSVLASQKVEFTGFDTLAISYSQLKEIVENPFIYENWHTALSSINAVYLIADKVDGQLYVGSAYNTNGLLGRWSYYVKTGHGDNKLMKEKLEKYPDRTKDFQFSILQILPKTMSDEAIIQTESLWKRKLLTKEFGMNDN